MSKKYSVGIDITALDKATAPIRKVVNALEQFKKAEGIQRMGRALQGVNTSFKGVIDQTGIFAARLGLLAGAGALAFKGLFLDSAVEFERYNAILETTEGSSKKAKAALDWVSEFATKTPYELAEVTDAFVKLRAYGMQPQGGLLTSLGNTASAMGKRLSQAVEAIADAVTGENERLKEFGIKARTTGNNIVYEYTKNGKTLTATAKKSSREQIQAVLMGIFNSKYTGAMDKMSQTFAGLLSNLQDQWTRMSNLVMSEGLFDFLKGELSGLLDNINKLMVDPKFLKEVKAFANDLKQLFIELKTVVVQVWPEIVKFGGALKGTADALGGYGNLLKVIIALMAAPLITSIISLVASIGSAIITFGAWITSAELAWAALGAWFAILELITAPITLVIAGIVALAAAAYLIVQNWGAISGWFVAMWQQWGGAIRMVFPLIGYLVDLAEIIMANWGPITAFFQGVMDGISGAFKVAADIALQVWRPVQDFFVGLGNIIGQVASKIPNNNAFTGQKSFTASGPQAPGLSMAPSVKMNGSNKLTAVVQPKKDMLDVALKVDFVGGTAHVASAKSRGDSNMNYKFDMGLTGA